MYMIVVIPAVEKITYAKRSLCPTALPSKVVPIERAYINRCCNTTRDKEIILNVCLSPFKDRCACSFVPSLRLSIHLHADVFVHKNGCVDLQADEQSNNKIDFGVFVEDANEKFDVDIGLKSERGGITEDLSVIWLWNEMWFLNRFMLVSFGS